MAGPSGTSSAAELFSAQEEVAETRRQLRDREREVAELRTRVDYLENLPPKIDTVTVTKPEYRTVFVENTEHVDELRKAIRKQQEDINSLREEVVLAREAAKRVEIETVVQEKLVEVPKVEVRTVEVGRRKMVQTTKRSRYTSAMLQLPRRRRNCRRRGSRKADGQWTVCFGTLLLLRVTIRVGTSDIATTNQRQHLLLFHKELLYLTQVENVDKITVLIMKCQDLESEVRQQTALVAEWQSKAQMLEQAPAKVVPQVIEVEDSAKIRDLLGQLNACHADLAVLKRRVAELEQGGDVRVE